MLEFMARKRAKLRGRLNLLFLLAHSRVLQAVTPPLCGCVYAEQTALDYDMHFFRSYEKRCQKSTRRVCAPSGLPWGWDTICTFFACTKKVPKKYPEGLRALSTPGDAVKFLRFDGDTANFAVWRKRIKTHFIFTP